MTDKLFVGVKGAAVVRAEGGYLGKSFLCGFGESRDSGKSVIQKEHMFMFICLAL